MALNERLEKKLRKLLAKADLEEDEIDQLVEDIKSPKAEEEAPKDTDPEEGEVPPSDENEGGEGEPAPEDTPNPEEVPPIPPSEEEVPPTDGPIEQALNELAAQEEGATPPVDAPQPPEETLPPTPPIPQIDPNEISKLASDLEEAHKTIQALLTRVDSLEEALKGAGVISSDNKVGDENPRITPTSAHDSGEDALDDVLRTINGK